MRREPPSDRVRVLIVDDDADFANAMLAALAEDGKVEVIGIARDGIDALEISKRLRPDVVLLDLQMPRMDGYEVMRRLKRRKRRPAVVVLTGVTGRDELERAARLRPEAFLRKTVDAEAIVPGVVVTHGLAKLRAAA